MIAGKAVGQQVGPGCDPRLEEGATTDDRALPAKNPCRCLIACPCFPAWSGIFSTAATIKLLSGLAVLRPGQVGSPRPPIKISSASSKPCSGRAGFSTPRQNPTAKHYNLSHILKAV